MSAVNGDKARFNRQRKQKIARRKRTHELLKNELLKQAATHPKAADTSSRTKPRSVPA
jgi:hypothetical protein